ncbi:hypothetical protein APE_1209d [Aeropyrum pernix K1]|uniref:Uncharacterized protein n=1 Tax=Aeropyrum pernix (strain ATCC 700893 / DSM 11879 / JCM 9820 / NBRC 100138 / K1) TaxID=272557 RepID=Q9YCQ0_AERPE|nr:hypothetical protein APE_1209d [Aeropyrum pernix K1]
MIQSLDYQDVGRATLYRAFINICLIYLCSQGQEGLASNLGGSTLSLYLNVAFCECC